MNTVKLRVGYACINLEDKRNFRTFRLKAIEEKDVAKIREVIHHNIRLLSDTIQYNIKNNIYVYRASADIIPFIANEDLIEIIDEHNIMRETKIIKEFEYIRKCQEQYNMRLSIHANHFLILASPKEQVVEQSFRELKELDKFLKLINGENIVLHIGGAYGNKEATLERFKEALQRTKNEIDLSVLTIENDDKTYTTQDIVGLCQSMGLKWVYDFHHERCNPSKDGNIVEFLKKYPPDKYHISSGVDGIFKPPHADYIDREDVEELMVQLNQANIDTADIIMEAKKKNLAIFKIMKPLANGYWELKNH